MVSGGWVGWIWLVLWLGGEQRRGAMLWKEIQLHGMDRRYYACNTFFFVCTSINTQQHNRMFEYILKQDRSVRRVVRALRKGLFLTIESNMTDWLC